MLLFIVITLFVLAVIWYYPSTSYKEHYAPTRGGPTRGGPTKSIRGGPVRDGPGGFIKGPPSKGEPIRGGPGGLIQGQGPVVKEATLTPDTLVTLSLGTLIQFLDKSGAGSVSN